MNALATAFDEKLRAAIGEENYRAAIAANRRDPNPNVCHSHDYCDANLVMLDAFECQVGRTVDPTDELDDALWNAAWGEWRAATNAKDL